MPTRSPRASCSSAGNRNLDPKGLSERSHSEYVEGKTLVDMIRKDLVAENDPTTRRMLEEILAKEEEHAKELKTLIDTLDHDERAAEKHPRTRAS